MFMNELSPAAGSTHVAKRKGRGIGTGNGKTGGRGHKGQKARSGGGVRIGFEGGQMPLARRIPKRGFNNIFAKPLESINVSALNHFEDGAIVDANVLLAEGILSKCVHGVKILGSGELTKKLTVKASAFSASAKEKIEAAGGKAKVVQTFRNAWKIPELRRKILFTLFIVLLYRLGNAVPVPYVDTNILATYFAQLKNTVLGLYNTMSGGAFSLATIFALSIQPYINASIIIQLLCIAIPALERLSKEGGEEGKKKIAAITRYSTVGIGLLQGYGYYLLMSRNGIIVSEAPAVWAAIVIVMTFTAGSALVMWLGEQITEFGIGNGISIILFASIVSRFPQGLGNLVSKAINHDLSWVATILMLIGALAMIVMIVIVNDAERRIPVQYAKRVVGRKMYGGQATYLPMKVNMSGVLPIIFAQSIASLPPTIILLCGGSQDSWFMRTFDSNTIPYAIVYFLLILFFAYFYATIQFNPVEVANNLKKNGGFIPGYRPGKPTSEFIQKVLNKVTLFGAVYLGIIACVPIIISACSKAAADTGISLGGTSIIIVVGVAIETVQALESQMLMRHYKGFLE